MTSKILGETACPGLKGGNTGTFDRKRGASLGKSMCARI